MSDDHGWSDISRCATSDALDVVLAFVFFVFIRLLNPINVDPSYTSMRLFLPNGAYRFRFGNGETGRSNAGEHLQAFMHRILKHVWHVDPSYRSS